MENVGIKNWVFHNASSEIGNGFELLVGNRMVNMNIEISGDSTGATLVFEGASIDNGAYYPILCVDLSTLDLASSTTKVGSLWQVELIGLVKFRVRLSVLSNKTVTVKGRVVD